MQQSKNGRRVGRVRVISALLPTTVSHRGRLMARLPPSLLLPREKKRKTSCFTKSSDLASKHRSTDCFKLALRNDYRGTPTKGLIVHCRWHISQGAFIAAWPLKSESCWVRGELAHTCITEEGTPVHPAARTRRVDPANPGVKADQRTGPESSAAPTIPSCPFFTKKEENKKSYIYCYLGDSGKTPESDIEAFFSFSFFFFMFSFMSWYRRLMVVKNWFAISFTVCFWTRKRKDGMWKWSEQGTVRCWLLTIIDMDHADEALIITPQPLLIIYFCFIFLSAQARARESVRKVFWKDEQC